MSVSVGPRPTVRIVPCLDVRDGRVVKGVRFRELVDAGDPVALAARYAADGADELCVLDISATLRGREPDTALVSRVRAVLNVPLLVGGGVRSLTQARALFDAGADKVALNSAAVVNPGLIDALAARYGCQSVVLALDTRRSTRTPSGFEHVARSGSEDTALDAVAFAQEAERRGVGEVIATSVDRDGTGAGFELELLAALRAGLRVPLIASGGGRRTADFVAAAKAGADALLAASLFHFGRQTVSGLKVALARRGISLRPLDTQGERP